VISWSLRLVCEQPMANIASSTSTPALNVRRMLITTLLPSFRFLALPPMTFFAIVS
jgi:hypothetical protein